MCTCIWLCSVISVVVCFRGYKCDEYSDMNSTLTEAPALNSSLSTAHSTTLTKTSGTSDGGLTGLLVSADSSSLGTGASRTGKGDTHSVVTHTTTSSEFEFRRDLAALDADISRLQIHFNVAMQLH